MALLGNIFANLIRYDVAVSLPSRVAKIKMNDGQYLMVNPSKDQKAAVVSFAYAGKTYVINPTATSGAGSVTIGGKKYFVVVTSAPVPVDPVPVDPQVVVPPVVVDPAPATPPLGTLLRPELATTGAILGPLKPVVLASAIKWTSNTTYINLRIKGQVNLDNLTHVSLINCDIDGDIYAVDCPGASSIVVKNCTMHDVSSAAIHGDGFVATANYVYHSAGDGFKPGSNYTIEGNYVTMLGYNAYKPHADGVQPTDGANGIIVGNYFDLPINVANTGSNSALFIQHNIKNVLFDHNWVRGGNFAIHAYSDLAGGNATIRITNNVFYTNSARFGFKSIGSGVVWSGNVSETGKAE